MTRMPDTVNRGMVTYVRRPIELHISPTASVVLPVDCNGLAVEHATISASSRIAVRGESIFRNCFLDVRIKGEAMISAQDCVIAAMWDGVGFELRNCKIGSARRPDGLYRRATEDGIRPCRVPGNEALPLNSVIDNCDIINLDGRNGSAHMDGLQIWKDGNLEITNTKFSGWWQAGAMLKSDHGPIDNVKFHGCSFEGANYFNLRIIDGNKGFGRPTNITITECVVARGVKGGANPINSGDDLCKPASQTKFVRTEAERLDPAWIVYDQVVLPDGTELPPPGGWYTPSPAALKRASQPSTRAAYNKSVLRDPLL